MKEKSSNAVGYLTKILKFLICGMILVVTVIVGFVTRTFDLSRINLSQITFAAILKVIIMAAAVIAAEALLSLLLSLP